MGVLLRAVRIAAIVADRPDVCGRIAVHAVEDVIVDVVIAGHIGALDDGPNRHPPQRHFIRDPASDGRDCGGNGLRSRRAARENDRRTRPTRTKECPSGCFHIYPPALTAQRLCAFRAGTLA